MKYSIKVNEVRAKEGSNIKGFATVVFSDAVMISLWHCRTLELSVTDASE